MKVLRFAGFFFWNHDKLGMSLSWAWMPDHTKGVNIRLFAQMRDVDLLCVSMEPQEIVKRQREQESMATMNRAIGFFAAILLIGAIFAVHAMMGGHVIVTREGDGILFKIP